jgi:hypothetical protein
MLRPERQTFMRILSLAMALSGLMGATTLEKLSMADMIQQSTAIVRAKVTGSYTTLRGREIYSHYQLQVTENLKGSSQITDVAIPGGAAQGMRQMVAGAPALTLGQEYVVFLWTGKSGLTQVMGLSQGLFTVLQNAAGDAVLVRPAAMVTMVDAGGKIVSDQAVTIRLSDLRSQIQAAGVSTGVSK